MHIIKNCGSCGKKIRFPIDRGRIQVFCRCGFSFEADPDDPELYNNARFDLMAGEKTRKKKPHQKGRHFDIQQFTDELINRFLQIKYKVQNFPVLTARDQRKMAAAAVLIILLLSLLIYLAIELSGPTPRPGKIVL